jgi:uncharacterized YccA/Bax inhibitor family protein
MLLLQGQPPRGLAASLRAADQGGVLFLLLLELLRLILVVFVVGRHGLRPRPPRPPTLPLFFFLLLLLLPPLPLRLLLDQLQRRLAHGGGDEVVWSVDVGVIVGVVVGRCHR